MLGDAIDRVFRWLAKDHFLVRARLKAAIDKLVLIGRPGRAEGEV